MVAAVVKHNNSNALLGDVAWWSHSMSLAGGNCNVVVGVSSPLGRHTFDIPTFGLPTFGLPTFDLLTFDLPPFDILTFGFPAFGLLTFGLLAFDLPAFGLPTFGLLTFGLLAFGLPAFDVVLVSLALRYAYCYRDARGCTCS